MLFEKYKLNLQLFAEPGEGAPVGAEGDPTPPAGNEPPVNNGSEGGGAATEPGNAGQEPQNQQQTGGPNAAFARMRTQLDKANKLIADIYKEYGITDIDGLEQAYQQMQHQQLQQRGIDPNVINDIISNHPAIKQATQAAEDQRLLSNFNELQSEYPGLVKGPEDITAEVWARYDRGESLLDAYTLVNRKQILDHMKAVSKQSTLNNINGKQHMKSEGDGAGQGDDVSIPEETLRMYQDMGMDKKQAMAHYKKLYS